MLPDHLCRRDVPGLDEAILFSEYARLEGLPEERVLLAIAERRIRGAHHCGAWYVEAPAICEERLAAMRQEWHERSGGAIISDGGLTSAAGVEAARLLGLGERFTIVDLIHRYDELDGQYSRPAIGFLRRRSPDAAERAEKEGKEIRAAYRFLYLRMEISPAENAQIMAERHEAVAILNSQWPDMKRKAIEESKQSGVPIPAVVPSGSFVLRLRKKDQGSPAAG